MTSVTAPKIVGKALYLEMIADPSLSPDKARSLLGWQHNGTKQVLIFPQYQDDTGKIHEPIILSRVVSSYSPRSQWSIDRVPDRVKPAPENKENSSYVVFTYYRPDEWDSLTELEKHESRKLGMDLALKSILLDTAYSEETDESGNRKEYAGQGWVVRENKPFSIEVTDEDYDDLIRERKTPQAVIRRINKVRATLDKFPAKLG